MNGVLFSVLLLVVFAVLLVGGWMQLSAGVNRQTANGVALIAIAVVVGTVLGIVALSSS